ncbi:GntR family transcriptional regulator [Georgenia halophila]|uniref:GntR family transcriptional regulator n=1 Tax=Georgenia halophila TaxID=620889 RepID=A0ABP8LKA0_9MICO
MTPAVAASVAEQTYTRLREAILRGRYAPGERLTSVRLADELGVSRTPIRAALTRLKTEGLVDFTDGRAAWVPPLTVEVVEEAYEIAEALESMLVERLALNATQNQLAEIVEAVEQMEAAAVSGDQSSWAAGDEAFHGLVHRYAGRELASSMLNRVGTVIDRVRFLSLNLHPEGAQVSAQEHRDVVSALLDRDPAMARDRHAAHLRRVREENVRFLRMSFPALAGPPMSQPLSRTTTISE